MRGYRFVDWLTQGYVAAIAVLVLLFHGDRLPGWPLYVGAHAAAIILVHLLIRLAERCRHPFIQLLRAFYPIVLYSFLYTETHRLDDIVYPGHLDGFFIDLDQGIFGRQLSRTMMLAHPQRWLAELLYGSYFSYYVMVFGTGLGMYALRRRDFWRYVGVVSFVFYACYLTYILLPVMGPHGTELGIVFRGALASVGPRTVPETVRSAVFFKIMGEVYELVEPEGGAAFPSSHVAVALTTLWFTWTCFRKIRLTHLVAVVLLCISTVYCGYHYAVDVLAGIITAAVLVPLGLWFHARVEGRRDGDRACGGGPAAEAATPVV